MRYKKLYPAVICFCVFLAAIGLVLGDPSTVLPGLWKIIVTEDALITDYVKIAGVSAALVNSALVTLVSLLLLYLSKEPPNGFTLVELGLMAGFSLFGKNIVNIWPIIAGTFLYAKARREPFGKYVSVSPLAPAPAPVCAPAPPGPSRSSSTRPGWPRRLRCPRPVLTSGARARSARARAEGSRRGLPWPRRWERPARGPRERPGPSA